MKVKELKKSLKNSVEPVYFVTGDDSYLQEFALNTFSSILNDEVIAFNLNVFEDFTNIGDIISALHGYPLLDEKKIVVVKEPKVPTKEQEKLLLEYFSNPEIQTVFVIFDNGDLKSLHKYGEIVDCSSLSFDECLNQINLVVKHEGRQIDLFATKKLAEYCLCDLRKIHNEIDKLICYKETGVINEKDVEAIVTPTTDYKIYEFTQSLADKNPVKAKQIMENLVQLGNKPLSLIQAILSQYKRMLFVLISTGTDEEIAKSLKIKPYAVKMSRRTAEHYSPKILKAYCERLVDLEYQSLTGKTNINEALKSAISILIV